MSDAASEWQNRLRAAQHVLANVENHSPNDREVAEWRRRVAELKEEGQRREFALVDEPHR